MKKESLIFALTANKKLAKDISDLTNIPLGEVEIILRMVKFSLDV